MNTLSLQTRSKEKGFTLVELAIVMIIIGLLITGILKGQEMISNAQVTATVAQIKGIDAATSTFVDMFNALPGDIANPGARLPNCTGTCNQAGNGNGLLESGVGAATTDQSEARAFFSHMAAADLLSGVSPTPLAGGVTFGEDVPSAEISGTGYTVGFSGTGAATSLIGTAAMRGGHYLALTSGPAAAAIATPGSAAMPASKAARIDRKMDDGQPNAGSVRAGGTAGSCTDTAAATGIYAEANDQNNCNLFVRIQG